MNLKYRYPSNPFIAYLNINFLQNKIDPLREILHKTPLEIVCIDETKLDDSFPDQQFKIEGYRFPRTIIFLCQVILILI